VAARRLLAALVAVALVVVAIVIRNAIDNGGSSGSGGGGGGDTPRLVCTPELERACSSLGPDVELMIEEPGITAAKLEQAGTEPGIDGWLAPGRWGEIVAQARAAAGKDPLLKLGPTLARSQIALAVWPDRYAVLLRSCPNQQIAWKCVGDVAGKGTWAAAGGPTNWGLIKIGFPDPVNNATGLSAFAAATVGYFNKAPGDLSSADLDDPGYRSWVRGLKAAQPDRPDLSDMLVLGPASAAAATTFKGVGETLIDDAAQKPALTYPAPVTSADVVLGAAGTDAGRRLTEMITPGRLTKADWNAPQTPGAPLPPADLLDALRTVWSEAR